jgi:hypothetical protein
LSKKKKGPQKSEAELIEELLGTLKTEPDRSVAILVSSHLEYLLERLMAAGLNLPKDGEDFFFEQPSSPGATFYSKTQISYYLGLLNSDKRADLDRIRGIRNLFAHDLSRISFDTVEIKDACGKLIAAKVDGEPPTPREQYLKASVRLIVELAGQIESYRIGRMPTASSNERDS